MSAAATTFADNTVAIAQATATAVSTVLPSVDQILNAGIPFSQVNQSMLVPGGSAPIGPGSIFNQSLGNLYYNLSFLYPQLETTGPILDIPRDCHPSVCSLVLGNFLYLPNIPANAFFAAIFALALLVSIPLSYRAKSWGYLTGMIFGLLCEILGYIGRIMISENDFNGNAFYIYIVCLTIGPAFLSFSIYTCLARIVVVYGRDLSRFKPKTYTYIFAVSDFFSLVLQALGGALASSAKTQSGSDLGINIMIAGLAFQVVSLTLFMALCADFALRIHRHQGQKEPAFAAFRQSGKFQGFLWALVVATLTIYVRSIFRVAELQQGFHSRLANNEVTFMILEAGMITVAILALTVFHPGVVFGDLWRDVSRTMKAKAPGAKLLEEQKYRSVV